MERHRLCFCCLLPGYRLSKCYSKKTCKARICDVRNHTLVHKVDWKLIERAKANRESEIAPSFQEDISPPPNQPLEPQVKRHQLAYVCLETGGRASVEVLPVVVFWGNREATSDDIA